LREPAEPQVTSYGGLKKDRSFRFNEPIQRQHLKASQQLPIFAKILAPFLASAHNFLEQDQGAMFVVVTVDQLVGFVLLENSELYFAPKALLPFSPAPLTTAFSRVCQARLAQIVLYCV
jgi:hypothetical protein